MWLFGCFVLYTLGSVLILDGGGECSLGAKKFDKLRGTTSGGPQGFDGFYGGEGPFWRVCVFTPEKNKQQDVNWNDGKMLVTIRKIRSVSFVTMFFIQYLFF